MVKKYQSGNIALNILLIVMFIIIAGLIYILAGGEIPKFSQKPSGVASPNMPAQQVKSTQSNDSFSDGLINPSFSEKYELDDFGEGISEKEIFDVDINRDGKQDRITRTRNENGTSHFYYQYKIELNQNGTFVDITPDGFRTTEGAECALQKLQFKFTPDFQVIKISRDWETSWDTPTMAKKTTYTFNKGQLIPIESNKSMKVICNVEDLF